MEEEVKAVFVVEGVNEKGFRVDMKTGEGFRLIADEPRELGGGGEGPNPIELFLASIASCFAITARIHAGKMGVSIERISVSARGVLDLRAVSEIDGVEPGLESVELRAEIVSKSPCSELEKVVEKTLRTWVVGSMVAKSGRLRVSVDKICAER